MNEQVKRNIDRFPKDFMFQLSENETNFVKLQIATSQNQSNFFSGQEGGRRKLPYAFTEQGIYMLATVLKGPLAEQQSIFIMRAFRELRHYVQENRQFVTHDDLRLFKQHVDEEMNDLKAKVDTLSENFINENELKEFVIYKGHKFEADMAYIDIYTKAKKSIYVVDDYVNVKTLQLLTHKKSDTEVILFSGNKSGKNGRLTSVEINDFNSQYPLLTLKGNLDCHDRYIVLDYETENERIFHCGHSGKDAGTQICSIVEIKDKEGYHPIFDAYMKLPNQILQK